MEVRNLAGSAGLCTAYMPITETPSVPVHRYIQSHSCVVPVQRECCW